MFCHVPYYVVATAGIVRGQTKEKIQNDTRYAAIIYARMTDQRYFLTERMTDHSLLCGSPMM